MINNSFKIAIVGLLLLTLTVLSPVYAEERGTYTPLFDVDLPFEPAAAGNVVTDYMLAAKATDIREAKTRWETFSKEHTDLDTIEDLTDLTLLRQASFELARIYFLLGEKEKGDKEMKRSYSIVTYEVPDGPNARRWCISKGHCESRLPEELKNFLKSSPK